MKFFEVDGRKYTLKRIKEKDGETTLKLEPVTDEYFKMIDDIARIITNSKTIKVKAWIKEAISNIEVDELKKMYESLKKGIKPKANKGCYYLSIGNQDLNLIG